MIDLSSGDAPEDVSADASPMPDDAEIALHFERAKFLSEELVAARREAGRATADRDVALAEAEAARLALDRYRRRRTVRIARRLASILRRVTGPGSPRAKGTTPVATPPTGNASRGASTAMVDRPAAYRSGLLARLDGVGGSGSRVGLAGEGSGAFGTAIAGRGWSAVDPTSPDIDVLLVTHPATDIRPFADGPILVAWVAGHAEDWLAQEWFDGYDLVLTSDRPTADRIAARTVHQPVVASPDEVSGAGTADVGALLDRAVRGWVRATRLDLDIGTPDWADAERWGDYHFARAMQRALQRRGYPTRVRFRGGWNGEAAQTADVVVHLFGYKERVPRPDQLNALWIISHPTMVNDRHLDLQDVVFVASDRFADHLRSRTSKPIHVLHQATDPDRFQPIPGGPEHQLLVVAGRRAERRPTVDELTPTLRDLAVYGHGWSSDVLDPRHHRGDHIPNDRLAAYYAAADIVLNDHWADMASWGFMANRLYDAAASGAFVLSDHLDEIAAEFDDGIATFTSGPELRALVTRYLAQPDLRQAMAERARTAVLAHHTFAHRAETLLAVIEPLLEARRDGRATGTAATAPAATPDATAAPGTSR